MTKLEHSLSKLLLRLDFEKAKDPNIWPYRVVVRKFVNFRRREVDEFAPQHGNHLRGVQPLPHGQQAGNGGGYGFRTGQGYGHGNYRGGEKEHTQQVGHGQGFQVVGDVTAVQNRFDVPGFREEGIH